MFHIKSVLNFLKTKKKLLGMIFHKKVNFIYRRQLLGLEDEQCCHPNISNDNTLSWQKKFIQITEKILYFNSMHFCSHNFPDCKQLSYVNEIN